MAQLPDHQQEDIYPSTEEIMNVSDNMKVVRAGQIPKGPKHQHIKELSKLPHSNQAKVIVLTYKTSTTTRATQIYLKHKETGTYPPFVFDTEEADLLIFNFVQSIVQQTQHHMFKQPEQCMQQAYSGLSIGMPVRAKEYTEQFKKNNNTVLLTETKRLDIATDESEWNDEDDRPPHRNASPHHL